MGACQQKKPFVRFAKIFEIYNQSGEVEGNWSARTVREVLTDHVSNDTAQIPVPKRTNILHKETRYEEDA